MLKIVHSLNDLNISQVMAVYEETLCADGAKSYPNLSAGEQLINAKQDFYTYLCIFFKDEISSCFFWTAQERYLAAVRLERYHDGVLLTGLETAPDARGQGNARALLAGVISYLSEDGTVCVYSHVAKKNAASMAVHMACGFGVIKEHARFLDGSVNHNYYTLACPCV